MAREKFEKIFRRRIDDIEREARALGITMTEICRQTEISRATPDRWRAKVPKTIALLDQMEAVLEDVRAKAIKAAESTAKRTLRR